MPDDKCERDGCEQPAYRQVTRDGKTKRLCKDDYLRVIDVHDNGVMLVVAGKVLEDITDA